MFIDLNVPFSPSGFNAKAQTSGKQKQKQKAGASAPVTTPTLSPSDLDAINSRLDTLVHLGYTIVALNYTVEGKIDPATHVNPLLSVPSRKDIVVLRRLTIILDEGSEKGFGLSTQHATNLASYDIIALQPTTANSFSLACLTHTQPSPTTAHIISIDAASATPQLPFRLKLSLVRTAIRNGAVFEISYSGALASDESARRNWWAGAREVTRATKGKGLLLTGGGQKIADLRAPLDAINLATILGLDQNAARNAMSLDAKSLVTRASTRQTYRAVLSAPIVNNPAGSLNLTVGETPTASAQPASTNPAKRTREVEDPAPKAVGTEETSQSSRPSKRSKVPRAVKPT
ncbi:hypothetical protein FS749_006975 [Ceratobasidium sp. UAMH 11750]|nr:hypothetical protein FS749_006975 [Ceratobasidium sp. UAMH 11750]